jgi:hypothetical protein
MSFRLLFIGLALLSLSALARAGMNADYRYTQRGQTDFDTVLQLLNPYGTWSKIDDKWAFTPSDHLAPYTDGRWIYTEYGWYWKGRLPHSWATEHYGYWKRGDDKVWSWYPGSYWLPQIVELRVTSKYIGWRSGEVDSDGSFVEAPIDRFSKPEEWTFVTLAQFANPITPAILAPQDVVESQLEDSTDSHHTYLTYRPIDRPGPHPADLATLCKDGGMLPHPTAADELALLRSSQSSQKTPALPATNSAAVVMTGTNAPALLDTQPAPTVDARQVKYWITMSLPTFWTPPPDDARPDQIYLYRPDLYQDSDGIARRITLWFNPKARGTLQDLLGKSALTTKTPASADNSPGSPAIPASPDEPNPFRSPLDQAAHSSDSGSTNHAPNLSSKAQTPAPSGAAVPDGLAPAK